MSNVNFSYYRNNVYLKVLFLLISVHVILCTFEPPTDICPNVEDIDHCCLCAGCNNSMGITFTPNDTFIPNTHSTANFGSSSSMSPNGMFVVGDTSPNTPNQMISINNTVFVFSIETGQFDEIENTPESMGHYVHMSNNFISITSLNEFNGTNTNYVSLYVKTSDPPWSKLFDIPSSISPVVNETSYGQETNINRNETQLFIGISNNDTVNVHDTTFGLFQFNISYPGTETNNPKFGSTIDSSEGHLFISAPFGNITGGCVYIYNLPINSTSSTSHDLEICNPSNDIVENSGFGANLDSVFDSIFIINSTDFTSILVVGYNTSDIIEIYKINTDISTSNISSALHQTITLPGDLSLPKDAIRSISIDEITGRIIISNSRFPSSFSARGKVFTYEYSNSQDLWIQCKTFTDIDTSFDTRFGQYVFTYNNTLIVSAPDTDSIDNDSGSLRFFNLSRSELCVGCDGITNSCNVTDECLICGGDNSTCAGCDGIPNSGLVNDTCGVCGGIDDTCVFIVSIIDFDTNMDVSGNFTINSTCTDPSYAIPTAEPLSNAPFTWNVTMQPNMGTAEFDPDDDDDSTPEFLDDDDEVFKYLSNDLSPSGNNDSFVITVTDNFGNMNSTTIFVNLQDCIGCDNITNSGATNDQCGVCGGNGTSCLDCNGTPFGDDIIDYCNECVDPSNANETCVDVFDRPPATVDCLSSVQIFNASWEPDFPDARMHWDIVAPFPSEGSASIHDLDGIITYTHTGTTNGTDTIFFEGDHPNDQTDIGSVNITIVGCGPIGCDGVPGSGATLDQCGICNGLDACLDCNGVPFGNSTIDQCGICDGNNSCIDCNGTPFGTDEIDACGECGGNNSTCTDCNGVLFGNATLDQCGECDGDGTSCLDCAGVPNGNAEIDMCGVCDGENACLDCAGIPNGNTTEDICGTCGGTITNEDDCPSNLGLILGASGGSVVLLCLLISICFIIFIVSRRRTNNNNRNSYIPYSGNNVIFVGSSMDNNSNINIPDNCNGGILDANCNSRKKYKGNHNCNIIEKKTDMIPKKYAHTSASKKYK